MIPPAQARAIFGAPRKKPAVFTVPTLRQLCWLCRERGQFVFLEQGHQCFDTCQRKLANGEVCGWKRGLLFDEMPCGAFDANWLPCWNAKEHV